MSKEIVPEGYSVERFSSGSAHTLVDRARGDSFQLTDRDFSEADEALGLLPSRVIERLTQTSPNSPVFIIDLCGGGTSRAARALTGADRFGSSIYVVNFDLWADTTSATENVRPIRGDAYRLAEYLPEERADLLISHMFLPNIRTDRDLGKRASILRGISQVLRPGGVAIIDESADFLPVYRRTGALQKLLSTTDTSLHTIEPNILLLTRGVVEPALARMLNLPTQP